MAWETSPFLAARRQILDANGGEAPNFPITPETFTRGLGDDWGSYYRTDPRVMAGYLPDGLKLAGFSTTQS